MFNVERWELEMRRAVAAKDAETLSRLMYETDHNGCFSYVDVCNEFGKMSREEWAEATIECAQNMLDELPQHTAPARRFLVRDESGRGWATEYTRDDFDTVAGGWDLNYTNDPDDEFAQTLGEWLDDRNTTVGDEFDHEDDTLKIIRIA